LFNHIGEGNLLARASAAQGLLLSVLLLLLPALAAAVLMFAHHPHVIQL
jgi:hypothetical protein